MLATGFFSLLVPPKEVELRDDPSHLTQHPSHPSHSSLPRQDSSPFTSQSCTEEASPLCRRPYAFTLAPSPDSMHSNPTMHSHNLNPQAWSVQPGGHSSPLQPRNLTRPATPRTSTGQRPGPSPSPSSSSHRRLLLPDDLRHSLKSSPAGSISHPASHWPYAHGRPRQSLPRRAPLVPPRHP